MIYLLGVVASYLLTSYLNSKENDKEFYISIIYNIFSWFTILTILVVYSNELKLYSTWPFKKKK